MTSFLEKLKKGMGIEVETEEIEETQKEIEKEKKEEKLKKEKIVTKPDIKKEKETEKKEEEKESWLESEGQLLLDLYQTENDLILQTPIAGVSAEDLEIEIEGDVLTIKGERKNPSPEGAKFLIQECYWGKFSRQIILPVEIDPNQIEATFKFGILTIRLPRLFRERKRKIIPK